MKRRKLFTIQEGHYTGPKDLENGVPGAFGTVTKTTLAGIGIGGVAGKIIEDNFEKGAKIGGKTGFIAGVLIKLLLNSLHNPMSSVKYQEVDKNIRSNFGITRVAGITMGDSRENRAKLDKCFAFNDRYVYDYKIIVAIQNNQVTMYTQNISDFELRRLSETLDYYCKKYYGMNYNSKLINSRNNSYSISITFTNYSIITDFFIEVAEVLETRINVLDNKAIVEDRIGEEDEIKITTPKFFSSTISFDKLEFLKILSQKGGSIVESIARGINAKDIAVSSVMDSIVETIKRSLGMDIDKFTSVSNSKDFNNDYLLYLLKNKLRLIEDIHYTVGQKKGNKMNIRLQNGLLFVVVLNNSRDYESMKKIDKYFIESNYGNEVKIFTYKTKSKSELEVVLSKLFNLGVIPNIFTKEL